MPAKENKRTRIELIDALRGLSVVLMVIHHLFYDLVAYRGAPLWLFTNPVFDVLHYLFAGTFIALAGFSSRYSRSNIKRGIGVAVGAGAVSLAGWLVGAPIWFGILHFLAVAMILYGLCGKFFAKIPIIVYAILFAFTLLIFRFGGLISDYLWVFGVYAPKFYSADYFPIFPWLWVFLAGAWFGGKVQGGKMPEWFYTRKVPVFPAIGRKAFIVYLAHQPVLYYLTYGIKNEGKFLLWIQNSVRGIAAIDGAVLAISLLGTFGLIWLVIAFIKGFKQKQKSCAAAIVISLCISAVLVNLILKNAIARIRPYEAIPGLTLLFGGWADAGGYSFPSGHTASGFAAAWTLKRYGKPKWLILAAVIALSRLYLGAHYPADILAGAICGILAAIAAKPIVRKLARSQYRTWLQQLRHREP
ncbi:MAG: heparan-alpha-glucosaminide N-acetyltransferase domain-containing protein [Oscillospiraceae bacterium]|nr:heparan-alpha-glucosaminide N-acetyltransferase domain-containing protein [Oscillospiraceae bacterium]